MTLKPELSYENFQIGQKFQDVRVPRTNGKKSVIISVILKTNEKRMYNKSSKESKKKSTW